MTSRAKVILYLVALHLVLGAVAFVALRGRPLWLLAAEGAFLGSIVLGVLLVRSFFVPLRLIRTGAELVAERDFTSTFRPVGQAEMDELIRVYNRMIGRLRSERLRVEEQNRFLADLLEASPVGVVTLDFDGRVASVNPAAAEILGPEPGGAKLAAGAGSPGASATEYGAVAGSFSGRHPAQLPEPLGSALAELPPDGSRVVSDGPRRFKLSRAAFYERGFARTFFLLEELTEELRRTEREAYETLIRLMSHEVNNSVGAVGSLLESLGEYGEALEAADRERFARALSVAVARLGRLRSFVSGYAEVVRLPEPDPRPTDVAELVDEILLLLAPELERRGIRPSWTEREELAPIPLDRNQMEQVLVNVLKNAAEAIGEGGRIELALRREDPHRDGGPVLEIRDTGPGLPPEVRERLFTPFFSTKRDGRGLGLTLAHEILTRHGFGHALENHPDGGAVLTIRF